MKYHLTVTPRWLLSHTDAELLEAVELLGGGADQGAGEIRRTLEQDAATGIRYPVGKCDHWDPTEHKCLGHPESAKIQIMGRPSEI